MIRRFIRFIGSGGASRKIGQNCLHHTTTGAEMFHTIVLWRKTNPVYKKFYFSHTWFGNSFRGMGAYAPTIGKTILKLSKISK
jgi:hypothetical protein